MTPTPTITSGNTVTIDRSMVLKVRAWKSGVTASVVRRADYVITGAIAGGEYHSLALKSDGTVWAWGHVGGIGDGLGVDRVSPVQVLTGAVGIAAGSHRSIAVKADGRCGRGATTPTQVTATGFTNIIAGRRGYRSLPRVEVGRQRLGVGHEHLRPDLATARRRRDPRRYRCQD